MSHGTPAIHANHDEPTKDKRQADHQQELPVGMRWTNAL